MTDMHLEERLAKYGKLSATEILEEVLRRAQALPSDTVKAVAAILQCAALTTKDRELSDALRCSGSLLMMAKHLKVQ